MDNYPTRRYRLYLVCIQKEIEVAARYLPKRVILVLRWSPDCYVTHSESPRITKEVRRRIAGRRKVTVYEDRDNAPYLLRQIIENRYYIERWGHSTPPPSDELIDGTPIDLFGWYPGILNRPFDPEDDPPVQSTLMSKLVHFTGGASAAWLIDKILDWLSGVGRNAGTR